MAKDAFEFPSIWKIWTEQYGSNPNNKYRRSGTQSRIIEDLRTAPNPDEYLVKNQAKILDAFAQSKEMVEELDKQILKSGIKVYGSEEAYRYNPNSYGYYKNQTPQQRNRELMKKYGKDNFKNNKEIITKFQSDEDLKNEETYKRNVAVAEYDTRVANENIARRQRLEELKNEPWYKNILMSDYAKERYVNTPEKSMFRPESQWYNTGEDVRDLMLGTIGLGADLLPGVGGVVLGPIARTTRDIANDAPLYEAGHNFVTDAGLNLGANVLPNWRSYSRMLRGTKQADTPFETAVDLYKESQAINEGVKKVYDSYDKLRWKQITPSQFRWDIKQLPESPMKQDLLKQIGDDVTKLETTDGQIDVLITVDNWRDAVRTGKPYLKELEKRRPVVEEPKPGEEIDISEEPVTQAQVDEARSTILNQPYIRKVLEAPELPKWKQKLVKPTVKFEAFTNKGSERVVKAGADIMPDKNPDVKDYDSKAERQQLIKNLEPQWKAGFIPREDYDDPVYLAYIQWKFGENK